MSLISSFRQHHSMMWRCLFYEQKQLISKDFLKNVYFRKKIEKSKIVNCSRVKKTHNPLFPCIQNYFQKYPMPYDINSTHATKGTYTYDPSLQILEKQSVLFTVPVSITPPAILYLQKSQKERKWNTAIIYGQEVTSLPFPISHSSKVSVRPCGDEIFSNLQVFLHR